MLSNQTKSIILCDKCTQNAKKLQSAPAKNNKEKVQFMDRHLPTVYGPLLGNIYFYIFNFNLKLSKKNNSIFLIRIKIFENLRCAF